MLTWKIYQTHWSLQHKCQSHSRGKRFFFSVCLWYCDPIKIVCTHACFLLIAIMNFILHSNESVIRWIQFRCAFIRNSGNELWVQIEIFVSQHFCLHEIKHEELTQLKIKESNESNRIQNPRFTRSFFPTYVLNLLPMRSSLKSSIKMIFPSVLEKDSRKVN